MQDWAEIRSWRVATREALLAARAELTRDARRALRTKINAALIAALSPRLTATDCIGFYWPIRGEVDLRPAITAFLECGATAALPVVTDRHAPLEFRPWTPGAAMARGVWDIPVPATTTRVQPNVLLVPLVGFDAQGFRLGYGGGFYDRTIVASASRPLCIGIGFAAATLASIHPQPHDIPMDAILTEAGWVRALAPDTRRAVVADPVPACASPPCAAADAPALLGWLSDAELIAALNQLLEAERAGARGVRTLARARPRGEERELLLAVANDEAYFCGMLRRHIRARGGTPSDATGAFLAKLLAVPDPAAQLQLLNRGQGWVVRQIEALLPQIADAALVGDLRDMLSRHVDNIARCEKP